MTAPRVLVTGGSGYLGRQVVDALMHSGATADGAVVSLDVREVPAAQRLPGVIYAAADIRDASLADLLRTLASRWWCTWPRSSRPGAIRIVNSNTRWTWRARATC
jgi:nucleoside-diphosphate-sugar epimerase